MLLSEASKAYLDYLQYRRNRSPLTIITYRPALREFIHICGNLRTQELDFMRVEDYATQLSMSDVRPVTVKNKLTIIRGFLGWMRRYEYCGVMPESIDLPTVESPEANFLTEEEQERFLSVITDARDEAMMRLFLTSGVRVTELLNLKYEDIYKRSVAVKRGKGKKDRVTFITKETERAVNRYVKIRGDYEGILFPNPLGEKLSRQIIARKVSRYAAQAEIHKDVSCHTLRHSMATTFLMKGGRLEDLRKMLGHANIQTTLIYIHFLDPYLQKSYDKIMELPKEKMLLH